MKRFARACLALLMACGSAWSVAGAQENNGNHYGWGNRNANQCGAQYHRRHRDRRENNNDDDRDDNNRNDQDGQYGPYGQNGQYGQYGQYGNNGRYNQCAGQYGNNGQYGRNGNSVVTGTIVGVNGNMVTIRPNNGDGNYGGYGGYGSNGGYGNDGYGQTITIDDQPALDNQTSGRVSVGRYVTAYGYWQNGTFYATRMN